MKTIPPPCPHPETGPKYWRSLDEVADTPEFQGWLEREFPAGASEFPDGVSRRNFMKVMASSFALAGVGLTGCRRPVENIMPFTRMPQDYIHGVARYYATAMPTRSGAIPLVVRSHDGRPIKIEGNPEHPDSNGGTNAWAQASILSLYDVDRAKRFVNRGSTITKGMALNFLAQVGQRFSGNNGAGLAFLLEPGNSPSRHRMQEAITTKFPQAKFYAYDAVDADIHQRAATAAVGRPVKPYFKFDAAAIIVSLDCDFLGAEEESVHHIMGFSRGRKIESPSDLINRLYVVEPLMSVTGTNADHRLRVPGSGVAEKAAQLANAIINKQPAADKWIAECAADLAEENNRGRVLVIAGHRQPLAVHLLAYAINEALGSFGKTVLFHEAPERKEGTLAELAEALNQGQVDTLVMTGTNPVYTAPSDFNWSATQRKAREIVRLSYYEDETYAVSDLHLPQAHYLESWGDARTPDGTYVAIQPLIEPLYGGLTELEVLARIAGAPVVSAHDIVRETFNYIARDHSDNAWKQFLQDGFLQASAAQPVNAAVAEQARTAALQAVGKAPAISRENMEVVFYRDYKVDDGRYSNNGWLQEMPDPVTKITWENVILISHATAEALGLRLEDFVYGTDALLLRDHPRGVPTGRVTVGGKEIVAPLWIQPGMADNVIGLALGYGRKVIGRVGNEVGANAYPLRTSSNPYFASGAKLATAGGWAPIACVQHHWAMEGRPIIREANFRQYQQHPGFAKALDLEAPPVVASLYPNPLEREKNNDRIVHQWGMSIDLNRCVNCQACMIACQSENNVPVVGKDQVVRQREMHWLRLDRYYSGPVSDPQVSFQPMLCQHCEAAPCENVCPVNATVHDEEGLNLMVYNRCVGTRYCSNNCPYKVRRFNFFDYNKRNFSQTTGPFYPTPLLKKTDGEWDIAKWFGNRDRHWRDDEEWELLKLVKNPEVSVRMRGVMEKCTFCVQRIESAKISQKVKAGASDDVMVPEGTIKTACQQACPAEAIVFGNLKNPASEVLRLQKHPRTYQVLDYLYTRPRVTYMARVRNPNPKMPDFHEYPLTTQEYMDAMGVHEDPFAEEGGGHGNPAEHASTAEGGHATQPVHNTAAEPKGAH